MKKFKVSITERIYATHSCEVLALDEDEALKEGRKVAFATPLGKWQLDKEIVEEETEEVPGSAT